MCLSPRENMGSKRTKAERKTAVARAVAAVGGRTKAAVLCGVSHTAIHNWLRKGRVTSLRSALKLSEKSGIPIEEFAADEEE
jgi:DNA-binding transcriptional regulator YdaS (Cro superfamily)